MEHSEKAGVLDVDRQGASDCGEKLTGRLASPSAFLVLKTFLKFISDILLNSVSHLMHIKYWSHMSPLYFFFFYHV